RRRSRRRTRTRTRRISATRPTRRRATARSRSPQSWRSSPRRSPRPPRRRVSEASRRSAATPPPVRSSPRPPRRPRRTSSRSTRAARTTRGSARRAPRPARLRGPRRVRSPRRLLEPGLHRGLVGLDPLLRGLRRVHVLPGDQVRDGVLGLVRGPVPVPQELDRRRAALRELRAEELLERVGGVRAAVLLDVAAGAAVVLAALEAGRQLHLGQVEVLVQVLRRPPVEDDRLVLLDQLREARDLRRLGPDAHVLE